MDFLTPEKTYTALLIVQALHLFHHRIAKRHISFIEVITAVVLCVSPFVAVPAVLVVAVHLILIAIQIVGSLFIKRLSPEWPRGD